MSFETFNNTRSFTASQYEEFKKFCKTEQPILKTVYIGSIDFISKDELSAEVSHNGIKQRLTFKYTEEVLKSLLRFVKINETSYKGIMDVFKGLNTEHFLKLVAQTLTKNSDTSKSVVNLVISGKSLKVLDIIPMAGTGMSPDTFFAIVETAMNGFENSGMKLKNLNVSENGNISVTILNDNWSFDLDGIDKTLNDEHFKTGMTIIKTATKIIINPFNERLVCTNGMVDTLSGHSIVLNSSSPQAITTFFEKAKDFGKGRGEFEQTFKNQVIKMLCTQASFSELNMAYNTVADYINMSHERSKALLNSEFHIFDIKNEFEKRFGVNLFEQKNSYKSKVMTDYNMWELVNKLTDIASNQHKHDYDYRGTANNIAFGLQRKAGEFTFKQHFDLGETVPQLFSPSDFTTNREFIEKLKNQ